MIVPIKNLLLYPLDILFKFSIIQVVCSLKQLRLEEFAGTETKVGKTVEAEGNPRGGSEKDPTRGKWEMILSRF